MKLSIKDLVTIALFTAITVIFAQISLPVPFSPVPITLSLFAVFLSAMLLGAKRAAFVNIVYVLLGICGAPVFQGFTGGIGKVLGPTGGYIISYIPMAFVMGKLVNDIKRITRIKMVYIMLLGLVICYGFGAVWLMISTGISPAAVLQSAVLPFIIPDLVKIGLVSVIAYELRTRLAETNILPKG